MDVRFSRFDPEAVSRRELLRELDALFHQLLLQTGGDVEEALRWLDRLDRRYGLFGHGVTLEGYRERLERERRVRRRGRRLELTARGEAVIRRESLDAIFADLAAGPAGEHRTPSPGAGVERLPETRAWRFGDALSLVDPGATLRNAIGRGGPDGFVVGEQDLEVFETEQLSSCATVLLVDTSHSMVLYGEDRITPAKRVAMALCELIKTRYPKDDLDVVAFGDEARRVPLEGLTKLAAGPHHTNTRAALRLAQDLLRRKKHANRQIFMITDGKPSALTERNGTLYKNPFGLDRRVVGKTLDEALACRRLGIPVTTFMLTDDPVLVRFVERFTEANRGRAYYARPDRLAGTLFVDYLRNRRRPVR